MILVLKCRSAIYTVEIKAVLVYHDIDDRHANQWEGVRCIFLMLNMPIVMIYPLELHQYLIDHEFST
jgi:hypothetical protein